MCFSFFYIFYQTFNSDFKNCVLKTHFLKPLWFKNALFQTTYLNGPLECIENTNYTRCNFPHDLSCYDSLIKEKYYFLA